MPETNLSQMIETALANLKKMTDANTVVGEPIKAPGGATIIPVSKISVGFASGGMDYNSKAAPEKPPNFGGGAGSGFTISPVAFLVVSESGDVSLLGVNAPAENKDLIGTISGLVDKAPSMIEKITKIFKKEKTAEEPGEAENDAANETSVDMPLDAAENGGG
ncbi:MAG: sporulation protein YtfJ [Oscillospiraceae bacterium]|nr:sporulation protein YtfJ [Oscillospiraceae bacterium]